MAEKTKLAKEAFNTIVEYKEIKTKDITRAEEVSATRCYPNEVKDSETCMYVEFISEEGIVEVFVPVSDQINLDGTQEVTIRYADLIGVQREFYYEYSRAGRSDELVKLNIRKENLTMGVSLTNETR